MTIRDRRVQPLRKYIFQLMKITAVMIAKIAIIKELEIPKIKMIKFKV